MSVEEYFCGVELWKDGEKIGSVYCTGLGYDEEYDCAKRNYEVEGNIKVKEGETQDVIRIVL